MRSLIVEADRLIRRIGCRLVDLASNYLARQVPVVLEELWADSERELLEALDALDVEAAEQDRTVLEQLRFDCVDIGSHPVDEIYVRRGRLQREWHRPIC